MTPSKTLSRILLTNTLLVATIACVLTGGLWGVHEIYKFNTNVDAMRERLVTSRKERMQREVDSAVAYLEFMRSQVEERSSHVIRERGQEAHRIASHLYETYKGKKSRAELENMVREALRPIRFLDGRGYYFATRIDGLEMLCATCESLEQKNLINLRDRKGSFVIRDMADLVKKQGEGYYRYTWSKPGTIDQEQDKLAYIKHFEPFDWFIGASEYLDDTESDLQQEALKWVRKIRYGGDGYLFVGDWKGLSLSGPATGTNMLGVTDANGVKIVEEMIRVAQEGSGFVAYVMPQIDDQKPASKISYARGIPAWQWYIGTGLYLDDIEMAVDEARQHALVDLGWSIAKVCSILLLLWMGVYWLVARLNARIQAMFEEFSNFFSRSAEDQTDIPVEPFAIQEFRELADAANRMTARRRIADEALRFSDKQFREMFDEAPIGYHEFDSEGRITRVNHTELVLLGYSEEEMLGHYIWEFVEERELAHKSVLNKLAGISILKTNFERNYLKKDGTTLPLLIKDKLLRDNAGTITGIRSAIMDISERKQAEAKINHLAFFDQLTDLPNRTLLQDRIEQAMASSQRSGHYGALLFLDLDYFKNLNDTLGHDMGDLLLTQVAQRLSDCVRKEDTVARLGGDEFVVMLVSLSERQSDAASLVELVGGKIITALNRPYELKDVSYSITPSIGASVFFGQQTDIDTLLKQADLAMYKAKEAGRNTLRFFDPDMARDVLKRAALESDLRDALQNKQFILHYQAQVAGKQVTGAEVLLRWEHPVRGLVFPGEFIPVIEETGLILPVGQWVLEAACKQLAEWAAQAEMSHLTVAVNISACQLNQDDFVDQVLMAIERSGANPERLKLELTESILVNNVEETIGKMNALKAKGVGFSLDDFGTGYSSLSYLKRLPLDQLKIDQSFVRDILSDPNDAAIARMIVVLAENLGLLVIAEGVETVAQRDTLAQYGCHAYQGYFFSRPVRVDEFESFVKRV